MIWALSGDIGDTFSRTVFTGPLLVAIPVALLAGLVSFLSPCVLPLVPGYLSFITGLSGADLAAEGAGAPRHRWRVLAGGTLFVVGFSVVFVSYGALFGGLGGLLTDHRDTITRVLGVVVIVLGLAFMGVFARVPLFNREARIHALPATGLVGAPVLGFLFALGWIPCIGPTLAAVQTLAYDTGTAGRGALLSAFYCFGLGVPFVVAGLAFRKSMGVFDVVKRHYRAVMRVGGGLLVLVGLLQVSGYYDKIVLHLQGWISGFTPAV